MPTIEQNTVVIPTPIPQLMANSVQCFQGEAKLSFWVCREDEILVLQGWNISAS